MNWLKEAYKPKPSQPGLYYTTVDATDFYQWQHDGIIPKGVPFTKSSPPLSSVTNHQIVAAAELPANALVLVDNGYRTEREVPTNPQFYFGSITTPSDLIQKYNRARARLDSQVHNLKQSSLISKYVISSEETPRLYKVISGDDENVTMDDYGSFSEVLEKIIEKQGSLNRESGIKKGRAYELSDSIRFSKIVTTMSNKVPIDSSKMEFVLKHVALKSNGQKTISWLELLKRTDPNSRILADQLHKFDQVQWVRQTFAYLTEKTNGQERKSQAREDSDTTRLSGHPMHSSS